MVEPTPISSEMAITGGEITSYPSPPEATETDSMPPK